MSFMCVFAFPACMLAWTVRISATFRAIGVWYKDGGSATPFWFLEPRVYQSLSLAVRLKNQLIGILRNVTSVVFNPEISSNLPNWLAYLRMRQMWRDRQSYSWTLKIGYRVARVMKKFEVCYGYQKYDNSIYSTGFCRNSGCQEMDCCYHYYICLSSHLHSLLCYVLWEHPKPESLVAHALREPARRVSPLLPGYHLLHFQDSNQFYSIAASQLEVLF